MKIIVKDMKCGMLVPSLYAQAGSVGVGCLRLMVRRRVEGLNKASCIAV